MAHEEILNVHGAKKMEQRRLESWVSHRRFLDGVDCTSHLRLSRFHAVEQMAQALPMESSPLGGLRSDVKLARMYGKV